MSELTKTLPSDSIIHQSRNNSRQKEQKTEEMFERWGEHYSELTKSLPFDSIIHQSRNNSRQKEQFSDLVKDMDVSILAFDMILATNTSVSNGFDKSDSQENKLKLFTKEYFDAMINLGNYAFDIDFESISEVTEYVVFSAIGMPTNSFDFNKINEFLGSCNEYEFYQYISFVKDISATIIKNYLLFVRKANQEERSDLYGEKIIQSEQRNTVLGRVQDGERNEISEGGIAGVSDGSSRMAGDGSGAVTVPDTEGDLSVHTIQSANEGTVGVVDEVREGEDGRPGRVRVSDSGLGETERHDDSDEHKVRESGTKDVSEGGIDGSVESNGENQNGRNAVSGLLSEGGTVSPDNADSGIGYRGDRTERRVVGRIDEDVLNKLYLEEVLNGGPYLTSEMIEAYEQHKDDLDTLYYDVVEIYYARSD